MLSDPAVERVLVFTRTKHGADKVVRSLAAGGIAAAAIHGNKSQPQRERALAGFKSGHCRVLVATDIAARGIDVDGVTHVVNYDLPNMPESYVHRIGRTARAGAAGIAISFCNSEERAYLRDIEKLTRMKVPVAELPKGIAALPAEPRPRRALAPPPRVARSSSARASARHRVRAAAVRAAAVRPRQGQHGNGRSQGNGHGRGQGQGNGHGNGSGRAPERQQEAGRQRPAHEQRRSRPADGHVRPAGQGDGGAIGWLSHGASRPR